MNCKTWTERQCDFSWRCFVMNSYPTKEIRSISNRGPIDTLSIYCLSERILDFQNMPLGQPFLKPWTRFIPRRKNAEHILQGSNCIYLCLNLGLRRYFRLSKPLSKNESGASAKKIPYRETNRTCWIALSLLFSHFGERKVYFSGNKLQRPKRPPPKKLVIPNFLKK